MLEDTDPRALRRYTELLQAMNFRIRLMARVYGRSEALRVFGRVPDDA